MAEPPLFVPVRDCAPALALRLFRNPAGGRTAVAFTSPARVAEVLGAGQHWVRLSEPALRSMLTDLDVSGIVVDPAGTMPSTMSRTAAPAAAASAAAAPTAAAPAMAGTTTKAA
jgi:SseB protein N-terminal domain